MGIDDVLAMVHRSHLPIIDLALHLFDCWLTETFIESLGTAARGEFCLSIELCSVFMPKKGEWRIQMCLDRGFFQRVVAVVERKDGDEHG